MRPAAIRHRTLIAALAVAAALFVAAPTALADTATSGSFQIQAGTNDTAGGRPTSPSHAVRRVPTSLPIDQPRGGTSRKIGITCPIHIDAASVWDGVQRDREP